MYDTSARLQQLLEPVVTGMGYELVGIEQLPARSGSLVRIYIDSEEGITLDDCERVSHQVSGVLDVEDPIRGQYTLEVSSPGLDRPLFTPEHFQRYAGSIVRIHLARALAGRRNFTGELRGIEDDSVVLVEGEQTHRIAFNLIEKSRVVPQEL